MPEEPQQFHFNIFNGLKVERVVTKHGSSTRP